jgi:hypothetical protein
MTNQPPDRLFKKLTPENWLLPDTTADHIVRVHPNGETSSISADDWTRLILAIELSPAVPKNLRDLFEVAQGVLCYVCFFYPLYTLGNEQVYRVLEAALTHKCGELGLSRRSDRFAEKIDRLFENGHLSAQRHGQWHAVRQLRNTSSHAGRQSLIDPSMAVRGMQIAADLIDDLFKP